MRRTLLLSSVPPCNQSSGCLHLDRICEVLPKGSLATYVVSDYLHGQAPSPALAGMPFHTRKGPPFKVGHYPLLSTLASLAIDLMISQRRLPAIIDDIVAFGRRNEVEAVWCTLQGHTMIRLALPVAEQLGVPLLAHVWDPPTWWLREHSLHAYSKRAILRQFGVTLAASQCIGAASERMVREYSTLYGAQAVPLIPFLPDSYQVGPAKSKSDKDRVVIGIAGQLYAHKELAALLGALDRMRWQIGGKQVTLAYLGNNPIQHTHANARIERLGNQSQQECIKTLSGFDILYCPYWFDPVFETEARLSFPSKFVSYLAASRPVFFHGPEYSSAVPFVNSYDVGQCCHSLNPDVVVRDLEAVLGRPDLWTGLAKNAQDAFFAHLSLSAQKPNLASFFQVNSARLAAA